MTPKKLSAMQLRVARLLAEDPSLTYEELGRRLNISASTAKMHTDLARSKLGYKTKREMARDLRQIDLDEHEEAAGNR